MLHFILGPSGSGKSYQMLAELRTRAERGERSILIVPEQFTSSTEGVLYRTLGDSLSASSTRLSASPAHSLTTPRKRKTRWCLEDMR